MTETKTGTGLRDVVHQRVRLGILAVLARRGRATFTELRDALGQSDGALSRHLGVLEQHELVATEKVFENRRPRTWVTMTDAGIEAFREEQESLAELLASATSSASSPSDAVATAVVFAALLDGGSGPVGHGEADLQALVPHEPVLAGDAAQLLAAGPISARYDFPETHADFGREQQEQRLMLMSHGLRAGWIATWYVHGEGRGTMTAQAMVLELGDASDTEAVLGVMGEPTITLDSDPAAKSYLLPAATEGAPATAVAWFAAGRHLASAVVLADAADAVLALDDLVGATTETLSTNES